MRKCQIDIANNPQGIAVSRKDDVSMDELMHAVNTSNFIKLIASRLVAYYNEGIFEVVMDIDFTHHIVYADKLTHKMEYESECIE